MSRHIRLVWLALAVSLCWSGSAIRAEQPPEAAKPAAKPKEAKQDDGLHQPAKEKEADAKAEAEKKRRADAEYLELYKVFADTMYQVEQNYVKDVNRRELMEAAIRGVLDKLDPYSNYISPDELGRFKTGIENQFGGIGIQITLEGGGLRVLSPIVGSPAYKAGLQAGDAIVEIAGKPTSGITLDEAVKQLKGEAGTSVTITVVHARGGKRETVTIDREVIQLETVLGDHRKSDDRWDFMLDHDKKIGFIRITAFGRDTASDLEKALAELKREGMRGLIVDLRFNPGGLLKAATDVADLFVAEGLIVTTRGRNTAPRVVSAQKPGTYEGFPMVVLVNRFSASASEIVSACLQDHHRAVIIGERTWGKGSVQNVIDLEDGKSALKLTTASYWRPNGHNIHRFPDSKESDEWGVSPDKGYELKLSDLELGQLMRVRRQRDIVSGPDGAAPKEKPAEAKDEPKTDDKKPADEKSQTKSDTPADDKKPMDAKPADSKAPEKKPGDSKPDVKDDDKKPAGKPAEGKKKDADADAPFIDRQLQKGLEYLSSELAHT
jgi:carboxyl-terminal processing protease